MRILALSIIVLSAPAFAQLAGTIGFDLVPGSAHFTGSSGTDWVDSSPNIDKATTQAQGDEFSTFVRINGAENLLGVTFDFNFDNTVLEVTDIHETRMDLDFSGSIEFLELNAIVNFFLDGLANPPALVDNFEYSYNDPDPITTKPGVLLDSDGDGQLSFLEMNAYINEFLDSLAQKDVPFWTQVASRRAGDFNESVEITDTVDAINAAGEATDNTVVLLRRPDTPADGFGYDSATYGSAIVLEVVFKVKSGAALGDTNINITNASGIDENFSDLTDVQSIAVDGPSVVTVVAAGK